MKIAFFTTIFTMNEHYLYDFFNSLRNQTYQKFDIIVVNDGYKNFEKIKTLYSKTLNIIELQYSNTPVKNREYGINYCIDNNYDFLIFGDSDDYFKNNRVEKSIELLKKTDVVVNDLNLFDENSIYQRMYLSKRLKNHQNVDFNFIRNKNIFGLSNTALKLKDSKKIELPNDLIALDWYIFSMLLIAGKKAIFTNETVSYYRQHGQNIIGLKQLDEISFNLALKVKIKHYKALNKLSKRFDIDLNKLRNKKITKKKINNPLWWEQV